MLYILYSNDYEVFLGGNHRPESEVLVDTTETVLAACEEIGVPMTLFADVACLWRYRELGRTDFPQQVEDQLRRALSRGHDVQAHIHPHWLETEIQWDADGRSRYRYDLSRFLLGNCASQANGKLYDLSLDLMKRAKAHLTGLLQAVDAGYRCVAYRAGNYGIQPGTEAILAALEDAGFLIDSSVVPGLVLHSNVNRIDFSDVPREGNYRLSRKHGLSATSDEGLLEIPVAAGPVGGAAQAMYHLRGLARRLLSGHRCPSLGYAVQSLGGRRKTRLFRKALRLLARFRSPWARLELSDDHNFMLEITRRYVDRYGTTDRDLYFSFSCHSKSADPQRLKALKKYHRRLEGLYGTSVRAITFQEAARCAC